MMPQVTHPYDHSSPITVTVVIVAYCATPIEGKYLLSCLAALPEAFEDISTDIYVVDNNSPYATVIDEISNLDDVRLIRNPHNLGFARAINQAISKASGRYILLLNPDTVPPPGSLKSLVIALESFRDTFAISPLLENEDGTPQFCWARFPTAGSELRGRDDRSQSPYPLPDFSDPDKRAKMMPFMADWVGGACFLVRKSAIQTTGALDERFFFYGEETEWCHRAKQAGGAVRVDPRITVRHYGGQERSTGVRRRLLFESRVHLYRKIYGTLASALPITIAFLRYSLQNLRHKGNS